MSSCCFGSTAHISFNCVFLSLSLFLSPFLFALSLFLALSFFFSLPLSLLLLSFPLRTVCGAVSEHRHYLSNSTMGWNGMGIYIWVYAAGVCVCVCVCLCVHVCVGVCAFMCLSMCVSSLEVAPT